MWRKIQWSVQLFFSSWNISFTFFSWEKKKVQYKWENHRVGNTFAKTKWAVLWDCEGRLPKQGIIPTGIRWLYQASKKRKGKEGCFGRQIQKAWTEQQKSFIKTSGTILIAKDNCKSKFFKQLNSFIICLFSVFLYIRNKIYIFKWKSRYEKLWICNFKILFKVPFYVMIWSK